MRYIQNYKNDTDYKIHFEGYFPRVSLVKDENRVIYETRYVSTIRINQNLTEPTQIVSGEVNGKAIQLIREHTHRYLCKYSDENTMTICQLDDNNSNLYADGTEAVTTGEEGDVMVRLPRFSYKATEVESDIWDISFAFGGKPDYTWKEWDGNDLIGAYPATQVSGKRQIYSISGLTPAVSHESRQKLLDDAKERGLGFSCWKWKHFSMLVFLFYAMYGNTKCTDVCGNGLMGIITTGATNVHGMNDTNTENGKDTAINFLGIENLWGGWGEHLDNVYRTSAGVYQITEDDGTVREIQGINYNWQQHVKKLYIGEYLDAVPTQSVDYSTAWGFGGIESSGASGLLQVSGNSPYYRSDFFSFDASSLTAYGSYDGFRLSFRGRIIKETDTTVFKSITALA